MQLQLIFDEVCQKEYDKKVVREQYKNELEGDQEYVKITEEIKALSESRKQIELKTQEKFPDLVKEIEDLKVTVKVGKEQLSNEAIGMLKAGQTVEVAGDKGTVYVPVWTVKFIKKKK